MARGPMQLHRLKAGPGQRYFVDHAHGGCLRILGDLWDSYPPVSKFSADT